jgi:hypothetical protein
MELRFLLERLKTVKLSPKVCSSHRLRCSVLTRWSSRSLCRGGRGRGRGRGRGKGR